MKTIANTPKQLTLLKFLSSASNVATLAVPRVSYELECIPRSEFQRFVQCLRDRMLITMYQIGAATGNSEMMNRCVQSFRQKRVSPVLILCLSGYKVEHYHRPYDHGSRCLLCAMLDVQSDERWCFALVLFARFVAVDGDAIAAAMRVFETRDLHQMWHAVCAIHDSYNSDSGRPRAYMPWGRNHTAVEYRQLQKSLVSKLDVMLSGLERVPYKISILQELAGLREKDLRRNGSLCKSGNFEILVFSQ